ncbi:MAG: radical SAM protein [Bacteroidetes bacterium]|nr:radical SAM protein [Bacteroidota bacterium]MBU1114019.1 radical SAM protein [Bacteroidota bacterium]MBU1798965.1 radical SAM protein [Bacteroidota bacterium]
MLKINEIFYSIQGESTYAGERCVFVRLTGCNLRCTYCDTEYAFYDGEDLEIDSIIEKIESYNCNLVEITGGEPLLQSDVYPLMTKLCDDGFVVLLETSGSLSIENVDKRVIIILDFKTPSSKMDKKNDFRNVDFLKTKDEVKFVLGSREDYDWAKGIIVKYKLNEKVTILFSSVFGKIEHVELVNWILEDNLNVRYQLQMHKYIWDPNKTGV